MTSSGPKAEQLRERIHASEHYGDYQMEIYLDGLHGKLPRFPVDHESLETAAHREVEDRQFGVVNIQPGFQQGGSGLEVGRK